MSAEKDLLEAGFRWYPPYFRARLAARTPEIKKTEFCRLMAEELEGLGRADLFPTLDSVRDRLARDGAAGPREWVECVAMARVLKTSPRNFFRPPLTRANARVA